MMDIEIDFDAFGIDGISEEELEKIEREKVVRELRAWRNKQYGGDQTGVTFWHRRRITIGYLIREVRQATPLGKELQRRVVEYNIANFAAGPPTLTKPLIAQMFLEAKQSILKDPQDPPTP